VVLFFVLSGFLLYRPYASAIVREEPLPSFRRYYRNRALRILPAYWVILAATAFVLQAAVIGYQPHQYATGITRDLRMFVNDFLLMQNYSPRTLWTGITPTWSLAIEVVFYVTLPLIVLSAVLVDRRLARRGLRRWAILAPVVLMVAIGVGGKVATAFLFGGRTSMSTSWHAVMQFSFLGYADVFAWGMLVAVVKILHDEGMVGLPGKRSRLYGEGAILLAFLALALLLPSGAREWTGLVVPLPFALLLAFVVLPERTEARRPLGLRFLETRPVIACGVVSYSIFLWNQPLLFWMREHGLISYGPGGFMATLALLAVLCGTLSALTYRYVELPALRLKSAALVTARARLGRAVPSTRLFRRFPA
ncbi:MAG TPA: acyltransferase, partial [Gaiellaceae bacterium]|nr:acyltransferase [Gaiellaceae bacterium]